MIFNIRQTLAFLSQGTTLMPGDIIFTGTLVALIPPLHPQQNRKVERTRLTAVFTRIGRLVLVWVGSHNYGSRMVILSRLDLIMWELVSTRWSLDRRNPKFEGRQEPSISFLYIHSSSPMNGSREMSEPTSPAPYCYHFNATITS
jgi:hypothetical protein